MFTIEYIKVEFTHDWMGNPAGSKMSMIKQQAEELKKRGVVIFVADKDKNAKVKSIEEPPINKMVESPTAKKSGRPIKEKS